MRRRDSPCHRERVMPASNACSRRRVRGSRLSGVARCRDCASTRPRSASRRRGGPREGSSRRWPRRRPGSSASSTAGSESQGNARSGARALHAARSPSTGGSRSRRPRCSTTWSCTSSVTCASRTTRDGSGSSSSDIARTGAGSAIGCGSTGPSFWRSVLGSDPAGTLPEATAGYLTPRCSVEANRCTARTSEPPTSIIAIFVARTPSAAHDVASSPMPAATPR